MHAVEDTDRVQIRVDEWSRQAFEQISAFCDELITASHFPSKRQKTQ